MSEKNKPREFVKGLRMFKIDESRKGNNLAEIANPSKVSELCLKAADVIENLLIERDSARIAFCNAEFRRTGKSALEIAEIFSWDCFKEKK